MGKKCSMKRLRRMSMKNEQNEDTRSIHSSRSSGTMRSRDGNWMSHSCQQPPVKMQYQRTQSLLSSSKSSFSSRSSISSKSPSLSRRSSFEQKAQVLNPYEAIKISPQCTFQKQATVNEAIVY